MAVQLRYLMLPLHDYDRRQHLVAEDNQPICGCRPISDEDVDTRRVLVRDDVDVWRTVCQKCTRAKAAYLERRKLQDWNKAARS